MLKPLILSTLLLGATQAQTATIQLTTQNTVNFRGEIGGQSITEAQLKLAELANTRGKATYPIYLVLDSPGGSIVAGDAFIQFAKTIPNVQTVAIFAASMAAGILEALPGKRNVTANGIVMFHRAQGQFQGYFEEGEVEAQLRIWKQVVLNMENTNATRMGLKLEDYKAKVRAEYWLYGTENVTNKVADEVVDLICTRELQDKKEVKTLNSFFGSQDIIYSGCPLFRAPLPNKTKPRREEEEEGY